MAPRRGLVAKTDSSLYTAGALGVGGELGRVLVQETNGSSKEKKENTIKTERKKRRLRKSREPAHFNSQNGSIKHCKTVSFFGRVCKVKLVILDSDVNCRSLFCLRRDGSSIFDQ